MRHGGEEDSGHRGLAFLLLSALCDTLPSSTECGGSGLLCPSHMYLHPYVHTHDVDKSCTRIIPCSSDARVEVEDKSTLRLKLFSLDDAYDRKLTFSSLVVRSGGSLWLLFHFNPPTDNSLHRGLPHATHMYLAIVGRGLARAPFKASLSHFFRRPQITTD